MSKKTARRRAAKAARARAQAAVRTPVAAGASAGVATAPPPSHDRTVAPAARPTTPPAAPPPTNGRAAPPTLDALVAPATRPAVRPWQRRWPRVVPGRVADAMALGVIALAVAVLMAEALLWGQVHYERDTYLFYYPVYQFFAQHLQQRTLPLWMPELFGGYPLYADGETGMLYPLHWPFFGLLPTTTAFIALRWLHLVLAGGFMYAWMRVLSLRRLAALLAALTFTLGSFLVGQLHHENLVRTAVWLPLVLCWAELAYQRRGRARVLCTLAGAATLGVQLTALHVQPALITLMALGLYLAFRTVAPPLGGGSWPRAWRAVPRWLAERLLLSAAIGATILGGGIALALAQLLPLYELGIQTFRGVGAPFAFSTSYSIHPSQLLTLLFPYFFRGGSGGSWQLWAGWETLVYVGIAPLVLALLSLAAVRRREVTFFGLLALFGALLAFGDYSPVPVLELLWNLPGLSALRVPGRYSLLLVVALAALAAYGLDWVERAARPSGLLAPRRARPLLIAALGINALIAALLAGFVAAHGWLLANPAEARTLIQSTYLAVRRGYRELNVEGVYTGLLFSLDLANRRTDLAFGLLFAVGGLLLLCWWAGRHAGVARGALVLVALFDLVLWGRSFHPRERLDTLLAPPPAAEFLGAQNDPLGRVWVMSDTLRELEYNRPAAWGFQQAGGYSSLEPQREAEYAAAIANTPGELVDLWGIRWVAEPTRWSGLPVYKQTSFYPGRPLVDGGAGNPSATVEFRVDRPATDVRMVAALNYTDMIPQGTRLGEIVVNTTDGREIEFPLRAGEDVSEWSIDRGDIAPRIKHRRAEVAFTESDLDIYGARYPTHYFYSEHALPERLTVRNLTVRYRHGDGVLRVFGLALRDDLRDTTHQIGPLDRTKYRPVYVDSRVRVHENRDALGRAFVVHGAMLPRESLTPLFTMYLDPFDSRTEVLLEDAPPAEAWAPGSAPPVREVGVDQPPPPAAGSTARVTHYGDDRVSVAATAERPGFLVLSDLWHPGWRAWVDGVEQPVWRGDYLFRAVPLAAGAHTVEFVYDPTSVRLGRWLSLGALVALIAAALATWRWPRRRPATAAPTAA